MGHCSFLVIRWGGYVAFAVARRLLALDRQVGLLGILDTNLAFNEQGGLRVGGHDRAAERARILNGLRQGKVSEPLAEFAARRLIGPRWSPLLRALARFPHARLPGELGFYLHEHLRARMLTDLVARLRPAPREANVLRGVPVVVFRAREQERPAAPDLGWCPFCPDLHVLDVDGGHHTMLDSPYLDGLVARVQHALDNLSVVT